MKLFGSKSKLDSKGILGGLTGSIGWGLAALALSRVLGVDIDKDDLTPLADNGTLIAAQWGAVVALAGAVVGLWGNWARQFRVGFDGDGKNPVASRGIMGNVVAIGAGAWAFIEAVSADSETVLALLGQAEEQWKIVAPALVGILGTLQGLWGRWRATEKVVESTGKGLPMIVLPFLILSSASCASPITDPVPSGQGHVDPSLFPKSSISDRGMRDDHDLMTGWQQDGMIATAGIALLRAISFSGGIDDERACVNATLFGYGPEICIGIAKPEKPPQSPPSPSPESGANRVNEAEESFRS